MFTNSDFELSVGLAHVYFATWAWKNVDHAGGWTVNKTIDFKSFGAVRVGEHISSINEFTNVTSVAGKYAL